MRRRAFRTTPLGDTESFQPSRAHPVRVRSRHMPADTHFEPHEHPWSQLACCATGIVQVTAELPAPTGGRVSYIVPPSRAVWIAPGARHAIHVLEDADLRTLYIHPGATPAAWAGCRMLVVSTLLRELVQALDVPGLEREREQHVAALVLDEMAHADVQALGVPLPHAQASDKRLRALCEAVLEDPSSRSTLAHAAAAAGASERTMARLFREQLGTSYQRWRQQAALAHALPLLARGMPVSLVAAASGYSSDSAFTAMFKAAMGQPPSHFQGRGGA